ncbi:MAG TPA: hypothetical protein VGA88_02835 [Burkholderiales bacterium]
MADRSRLRPGKPHVRGGEQKRARIAAEAARIMSDEGVRDFHLAKRKAAARLSISQLRDLPTNKEVENALADRLQLFHGQSLSLNARRLRKIAKEAMSFLASFNPRLVGPVLSGKVTPTSEVELHVSADSVEEVALFLREHAIPFELSERRVKFGGERYKNIATYSFVADGVTVELCVFDPRSARETPLSPIDGLPIRRGNIRELEILLSEAGC